MRLPRPLFALAACCLAATLLAAPPAGAGMRQSGTAATPGEVQAPPYWLTLERSAGGLRLSGRVPDDLTRTVLGTYAAALFGADGVENALTLASAGTAPADWAERAMAAAEILAELTRGRAELTREAVRVAGPVPAPERAGALTRELRDRLGPGIRVSTEFSVARPEVVATLTLSPGDCAALMTRLAAARGIRFDSGSAEVDQASLPGLATIAGLFRRCPGTEIEVAGFTDSEGDEDYNLDLSQARAEAVMEVLLEDGVPLSRLRARGFGEAEPIASNETEAGRARNRRIEFRAVE